MFNSLTGQITHLDSNLCCLEVGGVEYALSVSTSALSGLRVGERSRVPVYLYHREDQLRLFGFADESERSLFLNLLKVSGVGPNLALKILSSMSPDRLSAAIEKEDIASLSAVPGLGKKTAQKIILALQGSLVHAEGGSATPHGEIVTALVEMGFDRSSAAAAVRSAVAGLPAGVDPREAEERLLREAIVALSRGSGS